MQNNDVLEKAEETEKKSSKSITLTEIELHEMLESIQAEMHTDIKQIIQHSEKFSGPVPHPDHMRQYKNIDKSLPNRFTKMAESNLSHKQFIEKFITFSELFMGFLGWLTPTGISFYIIYTASNLIQDGKNIEALIALVTALATLGGAFYMKKNVSDNEDIK